MLIHVQSLWLGDAWAGRRMRSWLPLGPLGNSSPMARARMGQNSRTSLPVVCKAFKFTGTASGPVSRVETEPSTVLYPFSSKRTISVSVHG
jgi:hypothetical protein